MYETRTIIANKSEEEIIESLSHYFENYELKKKSFSKATAYEFKNSKYRYSIYYADSGKLTLQTHYIGIWMKLIIVISVLLSGALIMSWFNILKIPRFVKDGFFIVFMIFFLFDMFSNKYVFKYQKDTKVKHEEFVDFIQSLDNSDDS